MIILTSLKMASESFNSLQSLYGFWLLSDHTIVAETVKELTLTALLIGEENKRYLTSPITITGHGESLVWVRQVYGVSLMIKKYQFLC